MVNLKILPEIASFAGKEDEKFQQVIMLTVKIAIAISVDWLNFLFHFIQFIIHYSVAQLTRFFWRNFIAIVHSMHLRNINPW